MTTAVVIELVVGEPTDSPAAGPRPVSLAEADVIARAATRAGITALRLVDGTAGVQTVDPTLVGAYLAGRYDELGYLVDVPTTHHAPYNVARRVLSFDRASAGRVGVVLRPGDGDEVSDAAAPDPTATDRTRRWTEYADVLTRLWDSFPRRALVGDQPRAVVADDALIRPIDHVGQAYRVAGPLDGPSSVQGRPVLAVADVDALGWSTVARSADLVLVDERRITGADGDLVAALDEVGRDRADVALIGRRVVTAAEASGVDIVDRWRDWVVDHRLDGLVLAPTGGADEILRVIDDLVPALRPVHRNTLRAGFGVRAPAGAAA